MIQGRLYISKNHICFHANIFGWITNVSSTLSGSSCSFQIHFSSSPVSLILVSYTCFSCLHSKNLYQVTNDKPQQVSIPVCEITALEKKMTAFVFPNAIEVSTRQAKYTFTSLSSRDTTFNVINNVWTTRRLDRPEDTFVIGSKSQGSMDGHDSGTIVLCACAKDGTH